VVHPGKRYSRGVLLLLAATFAMDAGRGVTQTQGLTPVQQGPNGNLAAESPDLGRSPRGDGMPNLGQEIQARQWKRLREEHQKQVFSDTARLLELATALRAEADKGAKPTPGALKDVDEIAKLAKKLSERIKNQ
jgi:hypothetical protein